MTDGQLPTRLIAIERTIRLVSTARLRDPVLLKLVNKALLADLAEIEGATSGRLNTQARGGLELPSAELVAGLPHAAFINAAFVYSRPHELNRFNGPGRGAWYAALDLETCVAEVSFHMARELARVNEYNATVEYAEMFASFAGQFADLQHQHAPTDCLDPDPAVGYPAGNRVADQARAQGLNGIIYTSVRHAGGTCLVALWPSAVQSVVQGRVVVLKWANQPVPELSIREP